MRTDQIKARNATAGAIAALFLSMAAAPSMAQSAGQPGVVYPGGSPAAPAAKPAGQATAQPTQPGQPGAAMGAVAPTLPALPGADVKAGRVAVDDVMPSGLANDVRELKRRMEEFSRAQSEAAAPLAKPMPSRSVTITQAAGEDAPEIRVAQGIPTNVVFLDSTGQPWPIEFATPGDPNKFDVLMPIPGTANLQLRPRTPYGYGGLSVTLRGNPVPISLSLTSGQKEVDTRVDVKIGHRGPNAVASIIDRTGAPNATDVSLMSFLDGVPPQGSKEVRTSLSSVRAWLWNNRLVVRTELPLVSPAWTDSTSSPNGVTNAYILPAVPSILIAAEGRMITVQIDN